MRLGIIVGVLSAALTIGGGCVGAPRWEYASWQGHDAHVTELQPATAHPAEPLGGPLAAADSTIGGPAARSRSEGSQDRFGYASVGWIAHADFSGGLPGVQSGSGFTVTFPPLVPVVVVATGVEMLVLAIPYLMAEEAGVPLDPLPTLFEWAGTYNCGLTKPSASPAWSLDMSYSASDHEDRACGGSLTYRNALLGIRVAARTPNVRGYLRAGYGLHDLAGGARPTAEWRGGPYVGLGLEVLTGRYVALGVDYKALFFDVADVGVTAHQVAVFATAYWYW